MRIIVIGGGVTGLAAAMLLDEQGHEVVVLERDPAPPPASADDAWTGWDRRGVNQFRMLHYFAPGYREVLDRELPGVTAELVARGAATFDPVAGIPEGITGGRRPSDDRFVNVTARRPIMEAALAGIVAGRGIDVRRGCAVVELLAGDCVLDGVPHVVGVRLESGEDLRADVVVDASGRRSPMPRWLERLGARPLAEEVDDCGFVYYGRHLRSGDGSVPPALGPPLQHYGSVSTVTLPADGGTWGCGIITSAKDLALRALKDPATWHRVFAAYPLIAHWLGGEPIDDGVAVMAKIEDRHRDLFVNGAPVVTGVVLLGDSWACTNPSVGRGATIGLLHAVALRDALAEASSGDATALAKGFAALTAERVEPWYRTTVSFDRHRLAEIESVLNGVPYETDDPSWHFTKALDRGAGIDGAILRSRLRIAGVLDLPDVVLADAALVDKLVGLSASPPEALPGPSRQELLALVAG